MVCAGCGGSTGLPEPDPELYLRVGVDARQECETTIRALARAGLHVRRRIDGPRSCAVEAASDDGARSAVRVVTVSGVVVARDGGGEGLLRTPQVSLVAPPRSERAIEVLVAREDEARGRRCVEIFAIDRTGAAREVAVLLDDVEGDAPCVEHVRPVPQDPEGAVEALTVVSVDGLPAPLRPGLRVPLAVDGRRLVYRPPTEATLRAETQARAAALEAARAAADAGAALRLGVELGLCALLAGEARGEAQRLLEEAIAGLPATPDLVRAREAADRGLDRVADRVARRRPAPTDGGR